MKKLTKDSSILRFLERIGLEKRSWATCTNWDGDLCAIGIVSSSQSRRMYISTWRQKDKRYYYECELLHPGIESELEYEVEVIDKGDNATFPELLAVMERHLNEKSPQ